MKSIFDVEGLKDIAWCPGCGNYPLLGIIKASLAQAGLDPRSVIFVSGIGQAAKTPQYLECNHFNGLHGRALPVATGIRMSNPSIKVIAEGGDGDMYGEGGNHFIHTARRNPEITHLVHNNMVYGLTQGQASPTSRKGFTTGVQIEGVSSEPLNPLALALSLGVGFVARVFVGFAEHAKDVIAAAIAYKGYALVDIFDPCVSFNKLNTYAWYRENSYLIDASHDRADRAAAWKLAMEEGPFPLGILYDDGGIRQTLEEGLAAYKDDKRPLYERHPRRAIINDLWDEL
jgi:2-oxoglutarate ferredoxin oxidoreductase subunit beta